MRELFWTNYAVSLDVIYFSMEAGKANTAVKMMTIPAMPLTAKKDISDVGRIRISQQSNFKIFDALLAVPMWVQITVGKSHPLNAGVDCVNTSISLDDNRKQIAM